LFDVAVVAVVAVAVVFAPINPMLWGRLQSKALSMLCLFVWIAHNLTAIVTATAM
jgi:MFS-type transporter involved in bile tolerance (Atg22 family)